MTMAQEQTPQIGSKEELTATGNFRYAVAITNACMKMIERTESPTRGMIYIERARKAVEEFREFKGAEYEAFAKQMDEVSNIVDNAEITLRGAQR